MCDEYGFSEEFKHVLDAFSEKIRFFKIGDPSLNGSMVDLVHEAQVQMLELGMDPFMAGYRANEMPMSYLKMAYPREAFKVLTIVN